MADALDELAQKARAAKLAADKIGRLQAANGGPRFQSTPDGVFWGGALGNMPGVMRRRQGDVSFGLLFECDDPQSVADKLNAVVDAARATKTASDLKEAQTALTAATNELAAVLADPATAAIGNG